MVKTYPDIVKEEVLSLKNEWHDPLFPKLKVKGLFAIFSFETDVWTNSVIQLLLTYVPSDVWLKT